MFTAVFVGSNCKILFSTKKTQNAVFGRMHKSWVRHNGAFISINENRAHCAVPPPPNILRFQGGQSGANGGRCSTPGRGVCWGAVEASGSFLSSLTPRVTERIDSGIVRMGWFWLCESSCGSNWMYSSSNSYSSNSNFLILIIIRIPARVLFGWYSHSGLIYQ